MSLEQMARWAKLKGVHLVGSGDFTHPAWFLELKEKLAPAELEGLYQCQGILFILTAEVANFFNVRGRSYKMHNLIFAPSLEVALRINQRLRRYGSLSVDGRPALTLSAHDLLKIVKDLSPEAYIVPAHVWTPWFSLFGSRSGFDSIADCFGEDAGEIYALETGLSSDPPMNWRVSALDRITLISNSDAHSPSRLGREANVFA
jgi:PHP family Zn ribbon phosphoesterase